MNFRHACLAPACLALLLGGALAPDSAPAQDNSRLRLANGGVLDVRVTRVGPDSLSFVSGASRVSASLPYSEIADAEWAPLEAWTDATQRHDFGRWAEAAELLEQIAEATANPATYYPAPANYATRARRLLLDCYRRLGDGAAVARHLERFEPDKMPAGQREVPLVIQAWAAAGNEEWNRVLELGGEAGASPEASEDAVELAYLAGKALEAAGRGEEALLAYGRALALTGGSSGLARESLAASIALLALDPDREEECRAQVHLYATLFGGGELWEGAPEEAVAQLSRPLRLGEAALGQSRRVAVEGAFDRGSQGLGAAGQVTADHMKEVRPQPPGDMPDPGAKAGN